MEEAVHSPILIEIDFPPSTADTFAVTYVPIVAEVPFLLASLTEAFSLRWSSPPACVLPHKLVTLLEVRSRYSHQSTPSISIAVPIIAI